MDAVLVIVLLLAAAAAARGRSSSPQLPAPTSPVDNAEEARRRAEAEAEAAAERARQAAAAAAAAARAEQAPKPWPQAVPSGLAPWPSGWEPATPPSSAIVQRAWQLLSTLWARGVGTRQVEQTNGQWITYVAAITAGNKRGVVAYRQKPVGARAPASVPRPSSPSSTPLRTAQATPVSTAPKVVDPKNRPLLVRGAGLGALKHLAPHVRWVQTVLGLKVDGEFGAKTFAAVDQFQRSNGLKVDGKVGPETWTTLDRHPRASSPAAVQLASAA